MLKIFLIFCTAGLAIIFVTGAITLASESASNAIFWSLLFISLIASPVLGWIFKSKKFFIIYISLTGLVQILTFNIIAIIAWSEGRFHPDTNSFSIMFGIILFFWCVSGLFYVLSNKVRLSIENYRHEKQHS